MRNVSEITAWTWLGRKTAVLLSAMALLTASGCGGGGGGSTPPPPQPDFSLQLSSATASVNAGSTTQVSVSVVPSNGFTGSVAITATGLPSGVTASGLSVAAGASGVITVAAMTGVSNSTSTVTITGTQGTLTHSAALQLTVVLPPGTVTVSPSTLNFGNEPVSDTAISQMVTVQNTSVFTVNVSTTAISGTNAGDFSAQSGQSSCGNLGGGASCKIAVSFTPQALGPRTATLSITDSASGSPQTVSLSGTGTPTNKPPTRSRSNYVRTDAVTEYFGYSSVNFEVFDPVMKRFFVADPAGNEVDVLDAQTQTLLARLVIPGATSIDETPDHSTLWVATEQSDLYTIDPVGMTVTSRVPSGQIGPYGYPAAGVRVLANGNLVLLGGPVTIDGTLGFAVWNPSDNSITMYGGVPAGSGGTALPNCVAIGAFTLTGDRTKIVEGSILSDGTLCVLDPSTGSFLTVSSGREFLFSVGVTPDGKSILVPLYPSTVAVFDVATLNQTTSFTVVGDTSSAASLLVSPDSKTLWMAAGGDTVAYDLATGSLKGWVPGPYLPPISSGGAGGPINSPSLQTFDNTGLISGPMEEGVGFLDTTAMVAGQPPFTFANAYLTPATGPLAGGTQTTWVGTTAANLSAVYIGSTPATSFSQAQDGMFTATSPAAAAEGPATIYALTSDGDEQFVPDGFSYGPTILEVTPNVSVAAGGGTGIVYGYGFGSAASSTIPTDLTVTVGGKSVAVNGYSDNAYGVGSPPFLLEAFSFQFPAGTAGTTADIVVTTPAGTSTASGAVSYVPQPMQYPLPSASLAQGIYDAKRDVYYFTDAAKIQVFSRTKGKWLSPIAMPVAPTGLTHRLWGLAISADGSKLAVADAGAQVLYLLDPDAPASVKQFLVVPYASGSPYSGDVISSPIGLAVTNAGVIYYCTSVYGGSGFSGLFKLDTSSGTTLDYGLDADDDSETRVALTADESLLYFNDTGDAGYPVVIDTATDDLIFNGQYPGGDDDLALAANQQEISFPGIVYDSNYNPLDYWTLNDREIQNTQWVYGMKASPDGNLILQPSVTGLDVFDAHAGKLWTRIAFPFSLDENYDALVSDGVDNVLVAITGTAGDGVAVVDLSGLAEPAPWPFVKGRRGENRFGGLHLQKRSAGTVNRPTAAEGAVPVPSLAQVRRVPHKVRGVILAPHKAAASAFAHSEEAMRKGVRFVEVEPDPGQRLIPAAK